MTDAIVSTKEKDYLEQDPALRGQKYTCVSFISPEDVIRNKEIYFFNKYINFFSNDLTQFFSNLKEKFTNDSHIVNMVQGLEERYSYLFDESELQSSFEYFKSSNADTLESEYLEKNNFQTTIRGLKIRGTFDTLVEAQNQALNIKKFDKLFDVYVAEVGCWCPWSPTPEEIQNVEYAETQLNTLMKKYKENQEKKNELYRLRKEELIKNGKVAEEDTVEDTVETLKMVQDIDNKLELISEEEGESSLKTVLDQDDTWTPKTT